MRKTVFLCPSFPMVRIPCFALVISIVILKSEVSTANARRKRKSTEVENLPEEAAPKRARKPKKYVPALRSGAYALLLSLAIFEEHTPSGPTKAQLIEAAQPHCDSSFTAPQDTSKFYTAWNSMRTLMDKGLVYEQRRPLKRYLLTDQGWETARVIRQTAEATASGITLEDIGPSTRTARQASIAVPQGTEDISLSNASRNHVDLSDFEDIDDFLGGPANEEHRASTKEPAQPSRERPRSLLSSTRCEPIAISPSDFTIELVLDTREIRTPKDRDYIANELTRRGVTPIVRALQLGDAFWVAKCKKPDLLAQYGEEGDEIMLDWIVERKRLDDLIGSIKDSRFHEQKFRLRRSGMKNVIYLIEEFAVIDPHSVNAARTQEAVASAIASTQVVNEYFVKKTRNLDDTIRYLARLTSLLRKMYTPDSDSQGPEQYQLSLVPTNDITTVSSYLEVLNRLRTEDDHAKTSGLKDPSTSTTFAVTFSTFSALSSKSDMLTLRDLFLKMLMCTRGVTAEKALEIQRHWPTPREFVEAFLEADTGGEEGRKRAEELVYSKMGQLVGRKKVGKTLSKKIAEVWGRQG